MDSTMYSACGINYVLYPLGIANADQQDGENANNEEASESV